MSAAPTVAQGRTSTLRRTPVAHKHPKMCDTYRAMTMLAAAGCFAIATFAKRLRRWSGSLSRQTDTSRLPTWLGRFLFALAGVAFLYLGLNQGCPTGNLTSGVHVADKIASVIAAVALFSNLVFRRKNSDCPTILSWGAAVIGALVGIALLYVTFVK